MAKIKKIITVYRSYYREFLANWCLPYAKSNRSRVRIMKCMGVTINGPIAVRKGLEIRGGGSWL